MSLSNLALFSLFMAVVFGILSMIAKNYWHDKKTTQRFAFIAIIFTIIFIIISWTILPE